MNEIWKAVNMSNYPLTIMAVDHFIRIIVAKALLAFLNTWSTFKVIGGIQI
jgi:hypothetical protein